MTDWICSVGPICFTTSLYGSAANKTIGALLLLQEASFPTYKSYLKSIPGLIQSVAKSYYLHTRSALPGSCSTFKPLALLLAFAHLLSQA